MTEARGSVLLEAALGLSVVAIALVWPIEAFRRVAKELVLQHALFLYTRERALGGTPEEARSHAGRFVGATPVFAAERFWRDVKVDEDWLKEKLSVRFHHRYPSLIRFPIPGGTKSHFEIHRLCQFRF